MLSAKILIVEDNDEIRELLNVLFSNRGFSVIESATGEKAIDICEDRTPDAVVLDLTLPDMDGIDVCKRIRQLKCMESVPIIICSSRTHVTQRIQGLQAGADDYLIKPFDPAELIVRIQSLLKRLGFESPETRKIVECGPLKLDPQHHQSLSHGVKINLTPREFDLLYLLVERSPEIVRREEISQKIIGKSYNADSRVIDMHIAQIRRKLKRQLGSMLITIPQQGYQWLK